MVRWNVVVGAIVVVITKKFRLQPTPLAETEQPVPMGSLLCVQARRSPSMRHIAHIAQPRIPARSVRVVRTLTVMLAILGMCHFCRISERPNRSLMVLGPAFRFALGVAILGRTQVALRGESLPSITSSWSPRSA